jgi:hypothetical protein
MPGGYEYDVFVSYCHKPPVYDWVKTHFYPLLEDWLGSVTPHEPSVFVDWRMETGVDWPVKLQRALKNSRCLVAVWSPHYFRSKWCVAEWHSILEREKVLGLRTPQKPRGLVYPVVFSDGSHFPKEAKETQYIDLSEWNYPHPQFGQALAYLDFVKQMQDIAKELAILIAQAPSWESDWPVVLPPAYPAPAASFPRIQ